MGKAGVNRMPMGKKESEEIGGGGGLKEKRKRVGEMEGELGKIRKMGMAVRELCKIPLT